MLPLFSRPPGLPGPRQTQFHGRLLTAACFLFVVIGWAALVFPATASAYTGQASTGNRITPSVACFQVNLANFDPNNPDGNPNGPNTAIFRFVLHNHCHFPVIDIRVRYKVEQVGCYVAGLGTTFHSFGSGGGASSFGAPGPLNWLAGESTTLKLNSYCVQCTNGEISGFPPFGLLMQIVAVTGVNLHNPRQQVTLQGGHDLELQDVATLANDAHNPGPLNCLTGI